VIRDWLIIGSRLFVRLLGRLIAVGRLLIGLGCVVVGFHSRAPFLGFRQINNSLHRANAGSGLGLLGLLAHCDSVVVESLPLSAGSVDAELSSLLPDAEALVDSVLIVISNDPAQLIGFSGAELE